MYSDCEKTDVTLEPKKRVRRQVKEMNGRPLSRTTAAQKILNSRGRFFTVKVSKDGQERKYNCKIPVRTETAVNKDKIFGYVTVLVPNLGYRKIDVRHITSITADGKNYKVK